MTAPLPPAEGRDETISAEVILSEERLHVFVERRPRERVRLQRVVVTKSRTITVDVSHEEVRIIREPLDGNSPVTADGLGSSPEPIVMVLHEEQLTVTKTVVPVERVTLTTNTVTRNAHIDETVRHEVVDMTDSGAHTS